MKRVFLVVLDSVGIGAMPDAQLYGDTGANTLTHVYEANGGLDLPNLKKLGLFNINDINVATEEEHPIGSYGRVLEISKGKDTTTGHFEMIGINTKVPFKTYPNGFPKEVIDEFTRQTGKKVIGNIAASGTQIIEDLGEEHVKTGDLIVYTSADSVFQIAAHEDVVPLQDLYKYCKIAREILRGENEVARIIARPFIGEVGHFTRTANRHDYATLPSTPNLLYNLEEAEIPVIGVGKISDIFAGQNITKSIPTKSNKQGMEETIELAKNGPKGFIFTNLVDFDMKFGHRNDPKGYASALEEVDGQIGELLSALNSADDYLFIMADHGCDPTFKGTDHTRESVPLLVYHEGGPTNNLGTLKSFADVGQTIAAIFKVKSLEIGESFLDKIE
ncbi:MAG: phosphopentomutase [Candidatus Epulonipiscioides saccharophilum]|nr:MAG: phosphopentomutase [Epulopiscium sp. AS2M-Bin001]